jgi:hypothetical protein
VPGGTVTSGESADGLNMEERKKGISFSQIAILTLPWISN